MNIMRASKQLVLKRILQRIYADIWFHIKRPGAALTFDPTLAVSHFGEYVSTWSLIWCIIQHSTIAYKKMPGYHK